MPKVKSLTNFKQSWNAIFYHVNSFCFISVSAFRTRGKTIVNK